MSTSYTKHFELRRLQFLSRLVLLSWKRASPVARDEISLNEQKDYKRGSSGLKNSLQSIPRPSNLETHKNKTPGFRPGLQYRYRELLPKHAASNQASETDQAAA